MTPPNTTQRRRLTHSRVRLVAVLLASSAVGLAAVATTAVVLRNEFGPEPKATPCAAAAKTINEFRDQAPTVVAIGAGGYANMLRGIAMGQYDDVDGLPTPETARHLGVVADTMERNLWGEPTANELTSLGRTGRTIDALYDSCRTNDGVAVS